MRCLLIVLFLFPLFYAFAQKSELEKIEELNQLNAAKHQQLVRQAIDSAINLMEAENYSQADERFKFALSNSKSIPSDLTYYFGENSYYLGKYRQSIDWLTKYIQLKGTSGTHSADAAVLLQKAEAAMREQLSQKREEAAEILSLDFDIDCGPSGKVTCPVCNGQTVVVKKNYLGETFTTCKYCAAQGFLSCADYNKLLRGKLQPGK